MQLKNENRYIFTYGIFWFSTNDNLYTIISDLKSSGTIIVEDVTHTLFSKFERYPENDYYVASLRKWAGLPSGGFLASNMMILTIVLTSKVILLVSEKRLYY